MATRLINKVIHVKLPGAPMTRSIHVRHGSFSVNAQGMLTICINNVSDDVACDDNVDALTQYIVYVPGSWRGLETEELE